jgi:hypothetical protein
MDGIGRKEYLFLYPPQIEKKEDDKRESTYKKKK